VKISGDVKSSLMPPEYGGGFWGNVSEFFSGRKAPKGDFNSRLSTGWVEGFGGFGTRLKELFSPTKQAPLPFEVKPIRVKEIWSKDENFGWSQAIAIGLHVALIALVVVPLFTNVLPPSTQAKNKTDVGMIGFLRTCQSFLPGKAGWRRWRRQRSYDRSRTVVANCPNLADAI
jgi:hypothetical protein